jgi:hypothetical protein
MMNGPQNNNVLMSGVAQHYATKPEPDGLEMLDAD